MVTAVPDPGGGRGRIALEVRVDGIGFRRVARGLSLAVIAGACIALSGGTALAAQVVGETGSHGHYSFTDSVAHPGATCSYEGAAGTFHFNGLRVRPPTMYYPDRSSTNPHEHGSVAWQVKIQHRQGGVWATVKTGALISSVAYENQAAMFASKFVSWPGPDSTKYRALVTLTWYNHDASIYGTVSAVIEHYRDAHGNPAGACKGSTPTQP